METTTKVCPKCDLPRDEDDFNWACKAEGKRHPWCKECTKKAKKVSYAKHREGQLTRVRERAVRVREENERKVYEYLLVNPCKCGEDDPLVLQFDHIRDTKKAAVAILLHQGCSWETIEKEIAKCQVLCGNCHLRKTAKACNNWKLKFVPVS